MKSAIFWRYNRQYDLIGNIISGVIGNIISDVIGNIIGNVIGTIISYVRREIPGILYCCWEVKRSLWTSGKRILDLIKHLYGGGQLPWVIPPRFFKNCRNKCLVISCSVTITKYIAFQFTRSLTELHHLLHTIRDKTAFCCIQTRVSSRNAL